jgi:hypothetical protein
MRWCRVALAQFDEDGSESLAKSQHGRMAASFGVDNHAYRLASEKSAVTLQYIAISRLSVFFLFASSIKITGWQKMVYRTQLEMVAQYELNRYELMLFGLLELIGAVSIWFQRS